MDVGLKLFRGEVDISAIDIGMPKLLHCFEVTRFRQQLGVNNFDFGFLILDHDEDVAKLDLVVLVAFFFNLCITPNG